MRNNSNLFRKLLCCWGLPLVSAEMIMHSKQIGPRTCSVLSRGRKIWGSPQCKNGWNLNSSSELTKLCMQPPKRQAQRNPWTTSMIFTTIFSRGHCTINVLRYHYCLAWKVSLKPLKRVVVFHNEYHIRRGWFLSYAAVAKFFGSYCVSAWSQDQSCQNLGFHST